jgi:histone deacetylase 6
MSVDERMSVEEDERFLSLEAELADDHAQKDVFIWYASYGSNLLEARFNCYLFGGRVHGMSRDAPGARNSTPATESAVLRVPYRVFFAHARKSIWGFGGAAMLDVSPKDPHEVLIRLYKVTLQQFNDVVAQENGLPPPLPVRHRLKSEDLVRLRRQKPGSLSVQFEEGWNYYPAVAYLGDHNGAPILTFTCHPEDVPGFLSGELPAAPPAENYLNVLRRGVQELDQVGIDPIEYWNDFIKGQFGEQTLN